MQLISRAAPRGPGLPKNAGSRLNTGGRIERSGGYDSALAVAAEPWHGRTTRATNRCGKTCGARQIEPLCLILARDPLQVRRLGDQVGRVPAPRGLAAARAVAVNETHERPPDAIAHHAAETASIKHLISHDQAPFLIGIGQRYIDRLDPVKKRGGSLFATIRGDQTGLGVTQRSFLTFGLLHALKMRRGYCISATLLNPQAQFSIDFVE